MSLIPVVKVDKLTREVVKLYRSHCMAARDNGFRPSEVRDMCENRTLPRGRCYFRHADDFDPEEDFTGKFNCPIVLMDVEKGVSQLQWFPSMKTCREEMSVEWYDMMRALAGRILLDGRYAARYSPKMLQARAREK